MRGATSAIDGIRRVVSHIFLFALVLVIGGSLLHHSAHAIVAAKLGARITRVEIAGLQLVPHLRWQMPDRPVRVFYEGQLTAYQQVWTQIAGPGATWLVSLFAALSVASRLPIRGAYTRTVRRALLWFGLDLWLQTLPAVGIDLPNFLARDPHFRPELLPGHDVLGIPRPILLTLIMVYPIVVWLLARRGRTAGVTKR